MMPLLLVFIKISSQAAWGSKVQRWRPPQPLYLLAKPLPWRFDTSSCYISLDFQTKLFVVKYQHALSGSGEPEGDLEAAIVRDFGSVAAMKEKLSASTVAVQVRLELDVVRSKVLFPHILSSNTRAPDGAGLGTTRLLGSCKSPLVPIR